MFSSEHYEIFKNIYIEKHLRNAASDYMRVTGSLPDRTKIIKNEIAQSSTGVLEKCCFTGKHLRQSPIGVKLQASV